MQKSEAQALLAALIAASHACLDKLRIPHTPGKRTRPWRLQGGPEGIAYHYTGGFSGIKTLKWFNDPQYKNEQSSAHALIFDRLTPELELWMQHEIYSVFKVPCIIIADVAKGVWCTNWANNRCLGIENRNGGTVRYDEKIILKPRLYIAGRWWEPYTREQIEANILLGRIFRALRGDAFRPEWVVGHHQIWAVNQDPGPLFPLHLVRQAIFSDVDLTQIDWLNKFPSLEPGLTEDEASWYDSQTGFRGDPPKSESSWHAAVSSNKLGYLHFLSIWLTEMLYRLGWPTLPEIPSEDQLRCYISYFQRSTLAYRKEFPDRVLTVDGTAGPLTREAMKARLAELGL